MPRTTPRWRRYTIRAVLCLLLGAVTTVGVAWGGMMLSVRYQWLRHHEVVYVEDGDYGWSASVETWWFAEARSATPPKEPWEAHPDDVWISRVDAKSPLHNVVEDTRTCGFVHDMARWHQTPLARFLRRDGWGVQLNSTEPSIAIASGWPTLALWQQQVGKQDWRGRWVPPFSLPVTDTDRSTKVWLPLIPIFPGFLLDTLFYAAPWWLILITPAALRRWRRHRRGRCIHCGYDLAGLEAGAVCPECGGEEGTKALSHEGTKEET